MLYFRVLVLAVLLVLPAQWAQGAPDNAEGFVRALTASALAELQRDGVAVSERRAAFDRLMADGFDMAIISGYVLGRHWRQASAGEQAAFSDAFGDHLVLIYSRRMGAARNANVQVLGSEPAGSFWRVNSAVQGSNGRPTTVDWFVRSADDGWRVVDVSIEGVSMATTYRDQFSAAIRANGGDIAALTGKLLERNLAMSE